MGVKVKDLDNFMENFSGDLYYSLDPVFENNIKKLLDKKKVFIKYDKVQKAFRLLALSCFAVVAFILSFDFFLNKLLYLDSKYIFLTAATLIIIGFTSYYLASLASKKKADFDKIRLFIINETHYIGKHQDDRIYLAERLQKECDINIFHP
jgi:uncharacterized membrane protein